MSIIKIFKKGNRELQTGVDTYVVEWTCRTGRFSGDVKQRFQAFFDKGEAEAFAESIRRAHKLIGNTCYEEILVTVTKQVSGL